MDDLLTTVQVATLLQIHPVTLKLWRSQGKGPAFLKIGDKAIRYERETVMEWARGNQDRMEADDIKDWLERVRDKK